MVDAETCYDSIVDMKRINHSILHIIIFNIDNLLFRDITFTIYEKFILILMLGPK